MLHVVDGSNPEPEAQLASVREVLAEVGAGGLREVVVVNKADAADPDVLSRLLAAEPGPEWEGRRKDRPSRPVPAGPVAGAASCRLRWRYGFPVIGTCGPQGRGMSSLAPSPRPAVHA